MKTIWFGHLVLSDHTLNDYYKCGMQPMSVIFHILLVNGVQSTFHAEVSKLRIKFFLI